MIGRLIERLFVQVRADMSDLSNDLQQGVNKSRNATNQMAKQWQSVSASVSAYEMDLKKGILTQSQYMKQINGLISQMRGLGVSYQEAQKQVWGYVSATRQAANATQVMTNTAKVTKFNRSLGQTRAQMLNLGYQLNDVGMTLATGMNPMTVLIQQGSQILQIYAGQGGVSAALSDMGVMLRAIGKRLWPLGVLVAGFTTLQSRINDTTDVGVTFGDTLLAVFQVTRDYLAKIFGPTIAKIAEIFKLVWNEVVDWTVWAADKIINSVRVAVHMTGAILQSIPGFFEAGFNQALAYVYWAMADMTAAVSNGVGKMAGMINDTFGTDLETDLLSGATGFFNSKGNDAYVNGGNAGRDALQGFQDALDEAGEIWESSPLGDLFQVIRDQAIENALARTAAGLDDGAGGGVGGAASRAAEEVNELLDLMTNGLQTAADNLAAVFGNAFETLAQTGKFTFSQFITDMNNLIIKSTSELLQEELSNLFKTLATSQGGLGSMFSNVFTGLFGGGNMFGATQSVGARARGGVEMPWRSFVAGEEGAELINQDGPAGARRVATAGRTRNMMGQQGGGVNVTMNIQTPNVESFQKSQGQLAGRMNMFLARGQRNS